MTRNEVITNLTKPQTGKHMGDLVGWSMTGWLAQYKVRDAAVAHGLGDDLKFSIVRANNAYRRAVTHAVVGGGVDTRLHEVRVVEDSSTKIVHAIVRHHVTDVGDAGLSKNDATVETLFKVGFDKAAYNDGEPDAAKLLKIDDAGAEHPIAKRIKSLYDEAVSVYRTDDVRAVFQAAMILWGGMRMVDSGGIWWLPPTASEKVRSWAAFLRELYGARAAFVCPMFDTSETIAALQIASELDLEGRLQKLEDELDGFYSRDNVRLSTFETRLEEFARLRNIVDLHDDILDMKRDALREKLAAAEKSLCETLDELKAKK